MTKPDHTDHPDSRVGSPMAGAEPGRRPARWSPVVSAAVRLLLLALSMGGMLAVLGIWAGGDGALAFRILAGDIVLIVAALLLL